jgi:hypothetical protein
MLVETTGGLIYLSLFHVVVQHGFVLGIVLKLCLMQNSFDIFSSGMYAVVKLDPSARFDDTPGAVLGIHPLHLAMTSIGQNHPRFPLDSAPHVFASCSFPSGIPLERNRRKFRRCIGRKCLTGSVSDIQ